MRVSREEQLDLLRRGVDVLVIGGGITGAGVALDAASRGYRVGLVEQADFASGTSSRSTKLVHGGIRYLPQGHIGLVRDALRERTRLLRLAPHLVHPLPFLLPIYAGARRPLGLRLPAVARPLIPLGLRAGLIAYDLFARDPTMRHRPVSRAQAEQMVPDLRTEGLRAAFVYHDGRTDDVRLTHAVLATARAHGASTVNYARVVDLLRSGRTPSAGAPSGGPPSGGRVAGALIEDRLTGREFSVDARFVVNATGIWAERVAEMDGPPPFRLKHSLGTHLVLRPGAVRTSIAVVIPETDDGRIAFIVPWAGRLILGTTDIPFAGDLETPVTSQEEAAYLLDHAGRYLRHPLGAADVTAAFAGIRPLLGAAEGSTATLSRDHQVMVSPGGLISIVGGKLTTYRKMAEDTVNAIAARDAPGSRPPCRTARLPLVGSAGLEEPRGALAQAPLTDDLRAHLLETYGATAPELEALIRSDPTLGRRLADGLPFMTAEIVYACRAELAVSLTDALYLRTRAAVLDAAGADEAAPAVAQIMAKELGWDSTETAHQVRAYEERRDRERAWAVGTLRPPAGQRVLG